MSKPPKPTWRQRIAALLHNDPEPAKQHGEFTRLQGTGEMEYAFTSGGVEYFRFVNEQHIPALRAFAAKDVWAEISWRTTDKHLKATLTATLKLLNQGKAVHAGVLIQTLLDRLNYITHVDLLYKLASVCYVDKYENPLDWDPIYNERKTTAWKKDIALDRFFLQTRMINLLPFGDLSKIDLQAFTTALRKSDLSHLTTISQILSGETGSEDLSTYLTSQMEILRTLIPTKFEA